ncbi:hypothetical protein ACFOD4_16280 [Pseudoroseomonas globiformis]|uniref:Uncharacterized protein n=1 Tax=Teichococcus globiformis TaxID=2307229 RepID=A0ABV7G504_9PROT
MENTSRKSVSPRQRPVWERTITGVIMPGVALGLAAGLTVTLGTLVWSGLHTTPAAEQRVEARIATLSPSPAPEAPLFERSDEPAALQHDSGEAERDALLAEVEQLLRQADALDAQLDRIQGGRNVWPPLEALGSPDVEDVPLQEQPSIAALAEPEVAASGRVAAPPVLPGQAAPEGLAVAPVPVPDIARSADTALALRAVPPDMASRAQEPAVRSAHAAVATRDQRLSAQVRQASVAVRPMTVGLQQRCRAIVLRAQLGEEPSHADQNFLREGCR